MWSNKWPSAPYVTISLHKPRYKLSYKFVRYEKNFDDAAVISNPEKVPLNLVYTVHDTEVKAHIFNNYFSQTFEESTP